ncbi:MAG: hypothetical protein ACR2RV_12635 [Verrucomicrobiales bacterium]
MKIQTLLSAVALVFFSAQAAHSHHGAFYRSVFEAVNAKSLKDVRQWFSDSAWKGNRSDISATNVQLLLKNAESVEHLREYSSHGDPKTRTKIRCVVLFRVVESDKSTPSWIYFLAEHPGDLDEAGAISDESWRVMKIVEDIKEARTYVGREFFSDITDVSPSYKAEQAGARQPAAAVDAKPEANKEPRPESKRRSQ